MKRFYLAFCIVKGCVTMVSAQNLNVLTFNIRLNVAEKDSLNNWSNRKDKVAGQILFHHAQIVGVQEALPNQVQDLHQRLPGYNFVGVARETNGEFCAIYYDTARLVVEQQSTFWLSENTALVGGKGWDAACPRIVTYARFRDRITQKLFFVFNTHFDHMGVVARRQSALLLVQKVREIAGKLPVIVLGDFNANPNDEPIKILTDRSNPDSLLDSQDLSSEPHYGPLGTFNGFKEVEGAAPIDYIFIKNKVRILQHATLAASWKGYFASDHFAVFAKVEIGE